MLNNMPDSHFESIINDIYMLVQERHNSIANA